MGVLMQAAYRQAPNVSVPSPSDGDKSVPYWYDKVASQAKSLAEAGFTAVLLPPVCMTSAANAPDADGYGTYGEYLLGTPEAPTRFGYKENLMRCVAILRANGLDCYADIVNHQRDGGKDGTYQYPSATGKTNGRFPKQPSYFVGDPPRVPRDPIFGPIGDDFAFGDECAPINGLPHNALADGLISATQWLFDTVGFVGARLDDVKGMAVAFTYRMCTEGALKDRYVFCEEYDGDPDTLDYFVWSSGMKGVASVEDFTMHFACVNFCNNGSNFPMDSLQGNGGYFQRSPMTSLTFVENVDSDVNGFASVKFSKTLGYAYMLTSAGYPCAFWKDWAPLFEDCYGLAPWISNLVWIHEKLCFGDTWVRGADYQTYIYERQGFPGCLVGLNNDLYNGWKTRTVQTSFGPNVQLHDFSGHAGDVWTDGDGMVTIGIPENDNGQGYVCYSRADVPSIGFEIKAQPITQKFEGAPDLLDGPAINGSLKVGRIWCAAHTNIHTELKCDYEAPATIATVIVDPDGLTVIGADLAQSGWYTLYLDGHGLPDEGASFELSVTYTATQTLEAT